MQELRTATRYRLPLSITIKRSLATRQFDDSYGRIRDISTRGVYFFTSQEKFTEGDKLEFSVTFPSEAIGGAEVSVEAEARVVRVEQKQLTAERFGVAAVIERYETIRSKARAF